MRVRKTLLEICKKGASQSICVFVQAIKRGYVYVQASKRDYRCVYMFMHAIMCRYGYVYLSVIPPFPLDVYLCVYVTIYVYNVNIHDWLQLHKAVILLLIMKI